MRFRAAALKAVRAFAASNPWKGTIAQRKQKFRGLNQSLANAYGIPEPELLFENIDGSSSSGSRGTVASTARSIRNSDKSESSY